MDKGLDMYNDMTKTIMKYKKHYLMSLFIYTPASPLELLSFLGQLSHSGDLLLWVGVRRRASFVVRRGLTSSSQELLGQS